MSPEVTPPGALRRLAQRFALLAFALYHVPLFLNDYPVFGGLRQDGLAHRWGHVFTRVGLWVAHRVFHLTGPMTSAAEGDNGDTCEEYCRLLTGIVIAALFALAWTLADRRRPRAAWVPEALRILLRYSIVLGLAGYAVAKIVPLQFQPLGPAQLEVRVGELAPMNLLWDLMQYSRPYALFGGLVELVIVILLCFRRTTTLGALLCLPVMTNVALMNFCYGVPVKLFSTMMVVSAAVLVLHDAPRLVDSLWHHRAVAADPPSPPFGSRRLDRARWPLKIVAVGGVLVSSVVEMLPLSVPARSCAAEGTWDVVRGGEDPARAAEPSRWRRVVVNSYRKRTIVALRSEDEQLVRCTAQVNEDARTLGITCPSGSHGDLVFEVDDGTLHLRGTFDDRPVEITAKRRSEAELPLSKRRFSWAYDG